MHLHILALAGRCWCALRRGEGTREHLVCAGGLCIRRVAHRGSGGRKHTRSEMLTMIWFATPRSISQAMHDAEDVPSRLTPLGAVVNNEYARTTHALPLHRRVSGYRVVPNAVIH